MRTRLPLITSGFILLACVAGLTGLAQRTDARQTGTSSTTPGANTEPLILVVHGVGSSLFGGSGNRPDGWSDDIAKEWGVPVHEITFRYPGRTLPQSYTDFAYTAGDWAVSVQNQIQAAIKANPGRRVMIVSHS